MVDPKAVHCPTIVYRPMRPSDLEVLEQIHLALFPIRYESEFFLNVVNGHGIVSWAAVDSSRSDSQRDELIGFVTARTVAAKESEIDDLFGYDARNDQILVYVLTLGVIEPYRNFGIATALVREVIKYASGLYTCRAVYLHVISYNDPAIHFYKKMSFNCLRRLRDFYYINGQHYDSFLFVYYVNGSRSRCSPLDLMVAVAAYVRSLFTSLASRLWKNEEKKAARWFKCKETSSLLMTQNKRIVSAESAGCQCV